MKFLMLGVVACLVLVVPCLGMNDRRSPELDRVGSRNESPGDTTFSKKQTVISGGGLQLQGGARSSAPALRIMGGDFQITATRGVDTVMDGDCSCLCGGEIFSDGFESGDASAWDNKTSKTVPPAEVVTSD